MLSHSMFRNGYRNTLLYSGLRTVWGKASVIYCRYKTNLQYYNSLEGAVKISAPTSVREETGKVTQAMLKIGILSGMRCPLIFSRRAGSTGDLMKDCGWDRLLKNAYCLKEADRKDSKVEMRKAKEPQTGLAGQKISVDAHCEIKCLQYIDGTPRRAVEETHAVIRRRPKLVTQQGTNNVGVWELTLDVKERWENPCMGWSSNGYPLSNLNLYFRSSEEASVFARKRGWSFEVEDSDMPEKPKRHKAKSYAEIFSWNSRKRMSTK